jgi:hypothetical protein
MRMNAASKRDSSVSAPQKIFSCPLPSPASVEPHLAAAQQHEAGDALIGVGDEDAARSERGRDLRRRSSRPSRRTVWWG